MRKIFTMITNLLAIALLVLPFQCVSVRSVGESSWLTMTPMPTARCELASATLDSKIYVLGGGEQTPQFLATNEVYDASTDSWSVAASMPTPRGSGFVAETVNGKIYAIGGLNDPLGWSSLKVNEMYDPETNTWATRAPLPFERHGTAGAVVNDKIYVIGGYSPPWNSQIMLDWNDMYDPSTDTWFPRALLPTPRRAHAVAAVGDKIYVIGGQYIDPYGVVCSTGTNEMYDPATNTWTTKAPMPAPREGHALAVVNDKIYAIGGQYHVPPTKTILNTVEEYDPSTDSWKSIENMPTARVMLTAQAVSGTIYVIGGYNGTDALSTNEAFTPAPTKWAVVIGMDEYQDPKQNTHGGPGNSATDMNKTLVEYMNFPSNHVHLNVDRVDVFDDDVTKAIVESELKWLQTVAMPEDTVVFYYAGHGGQSQPFEYIQMHDTIMWDDDFAVEIDKIKSQNLVVILDVSFSGGFITDGQTLWQGIRGIVPSWTDLAEEAPSGRVVLTACAENVGPWLGKFPLRDAREWSFTLIRYETVFTHYLVQGFKGSADYNLDGKVTVEESFKYAHRQSLWSQTPMIYDGYPEYDGKGELYLGD